MPPSRVGLLLLCQMDEADEWATENILFSLPYDEERYQLTLEVRICFRVTPVELTTPGV
jgi:hypothetical protein